jgi:hypothetical protein
MVDPFDGPEIAMLAVACVGLLGTIVTVWFSRSAKQNAEAAKEQVQNSHGTNLRDDLDGIKAMVDGLDRGQIHIIRKLGTVESEVGLLKAGFQYNREDIDDLMDTAGKPRQSEWAEPRPGTRRARRYGNV